MTALLTSRSSIAASAARILALMVMMFAVLGLNLRAADPHAPAAAQVEQGGDSKAAPDAGKKKEEHHALPAKAPVITGIINNSMIVTWIVAAAVIIFAQIATRRIRSTKAAALEAPTGAQNFWEFLVEGLRNFLEEIIGRDLTKKTFWFFATIFIFILFTNWAGLLPGVGTIGWGYPDANGVMGHIERPLFRGTSADLNMTFAMSMIFFVLWTIWALQANGPGGFIKHLFGAKGGMKGIMGLMMAVVFIAVGLLEVVSIIFRPVSLSFRLYGNVFAGETLLESMSAMAPAFGWLLPLPFYFIELLVGFVQALVFMLLTSVFTLLICSHDEEHAEGEPAHH